MMSYKLTGTCHGSGDSYLISDIFPDGDADELFYQLRDEINWQEVKQKGGVIPRGVSIQGTLIQMDGDTYEPLYRHPVDEQPMLIQWTPIADKIRWKIEDFTKQSLNHALIQYYKNGFDFIGEHTDKTLDIQRDTDIFNYSLGATRTMVLRRKSDGHRERIKLGHNSLFVLGWKTNKEYLHSVKQDRRMESEKDEAERSFEGQRISLTLRTVPTFRNLRTGALSGQGAARVGDCDAEVTNDEELMLHAFSAENKMGLDFDWHKYYGNGFNALNFRIFNSEHKEENAETSPEPSNVTRIGT